MHVCMFACVYVCVWVYVCMFVCVGLFVCLCVWLCVCVLTRVLKTALRNCGTCTMKTEKYLAATCLDETREETNRSIN